jgi:transposase
VFPGYGSSSSGHPHDVPRRDEGLRDLPFPGPATIARGFEVTLLLPHYVKPYRRRSRTDRADCEAILEAGRCAGIHPVAIKSEDQQALVGSSPRPVPGDREPARPDQRHARAAAEGRRGRTPRIEVLHERPAPAAR